MEPLPWEGLGEYFDCENFRFYKKILYKIRIQFLVVVAASKQIDLKVSNGRMKNMVTSGDRNAGQSNNVKT